jgi:hypothetical protein
MLAGAAMAALNSLMTASIAAEPPIGSRVGERLDKSEVRNDRDAVQAAHELAGCIVIKRPSTARSFLDARNREEVNKLALKMSGDVDCMVNIDRNDLVEGVRVTYPQEIMRGDIAEELLKRNQSAVQQLAPVPIEKTYARSWFAVTGRNMSVDEMSACVANTNPSAIMALVRAEPFSDEENFAFGNLIPAMGPCLVAGAKLDAKREPLRAALAEALYQRLMNPAENVTPVVSDEPKAPRK